MKSYFSIRNVDLNSGDLFFIMGPCVIEDEDLVFSIAEELKKICERNSIKYIFKASFDKANRSSLGSYRGPGIKEGLRILGDISRELDIPVISDVHEVWQIESAAQYLSAIQIPAFLSRQTDLLVESAKSGLPVNIKKAQFMAPEDMSLAAAKVRESGNSKIMLTERGTSFGYRNLVVDYRSIPVMKSNGYPVIIDATHSVQRPSAGKGVSGGDPEFIPVIAGAGVVAGVDGVFMEVHPDPSKAKSDGANSMPLSEVEGIIKRLKRLKEVENEYT